MFKGSNYNVASGYDVTRHPEAVGKARRRMLSVAVGRGGGGVGFCVKGVHQLSRRSGGGGGGRGGGGGGGIHFRCGMSTRPRPLSPALPEPVSLIAIDNSLFN